MNVAFSTILVQVRRFSSSVCECISCSFQIAQLVSPMNCRSTTRTGSRRSGGPTECRTHHFLPSGSHLAQHALVTLILASQDPSWLTPAYMINPLALWEVRAAASRVDPFTSTVFFTVISRVCSQQLRWQATESMLVPLTYGEHTWEGGDVLWDYASWAHEPQSVDGPIYR